VQKYTFISFAKIYLYYLNVKYSYFFENSLAES